MVENKSRVVEVHIHQQFTGKFQDRGIFGYALQFQQFFQQFFLVGQFIVGTPGRFTESVEVIQQQAAEGGINLFPALQDLFQFAYAPPYILPGQLKVAGGHGCSAVKIFPEIIFKEIKDGTGMAAEAFIEPRKFRGSLLITVQPVQHFDKHRLVELDIEFHFLLLGLGIDIFHKVRPELIPLCGRGSDKLLKVFLAGVERFSGDTVVLVSVSQGWRV